MDAIILYLAKLWLEINSCEEQIFQAFLLGETFRRKFKINGVRIPVRKLGALTDLYKSKPGYFVCWNKWSTKAFRGKEDYFIISILTEYENFLKKVPGAKAPKRPREVDEMM